MLDCFGGPLPSEQGWKGSQEAWPGEAEGFPMEHIVSGAALSELIPLGSQEGIGAGCVRAPMQKKQTCYLWGNMFSS